MKYVNMTVWGVCVGGEREREREREIEIRDEDEKGFSFEALHTTKIKIQSNSPV
jgi:hypothetical protein